jgi:hypothetical protein
VIEEARDMGLTASCVPYIQDWRSLIGESTYHAELDELAAVRDQKL